MALINSQFLKIAYNEVQERVETKLSLFRSLNAHAKLIALNSGDVTRPLPPCVVQAMTRSVAEMGEEATFRGRSPIDGYDFLIDAIVKFNHKVKKLDIRRSEIFINDGTKEDLAGFGDILCRDNRIAVTDPVFQTFVEANVLSSRGGDRDEDRRWSHIIYLDCTKENGYLPRFPELRPDLIYLNFPSNPTGAAMSRSELERWVKYALDNDTIILFDATYEWFITDPDIPHSIYEIKGAKRCAIEFRSFSKSAGFTGLHCGYTIIPKEIMGYSVTEDRKESLSRLWRMRRAIKSYAPSYLVQRGVESLYTAEGVASVRSNVDYYMKNAAILSDALRTAGFSFSGGVNSPYLWVESPSGSSWKLFDQLLNECHIVSAPGERFGACGKGYVRLSAFANQSKVMMASVRIADLRR